MRCPDRGGAALPLMTVGAHRHPTTMAVSIGGAATTTGGRGAEHEHHEGCDQHRHERGTTEPY